MRRQHAEATSGHQHPLDPKGGCGPGRPVPIGTQETLVNPCIRAGVIADGDQGGDLGGHG